MAYQGLDKAYIVTPPAHPPPPQSLYWIADDNLKVKKIESFKTRLNFDWIRVKRPTFSDDAGSNMWQMSYLCNTLIKLAFIVADVFLELMTVWVQFFKLVF